MAVWLLLIPALTKVRNVFIYLDMKEVMTHGTLFLLHGAQNLNKVQVIHVLQLI
jgi:hypothetical protein